MFFINMLHVQRGKGLIMGMLEQVRCNVNTLTLFHLISLSYLLSPTHVFLSLGQVFHYVSTL